MNSSPLPYGTWVPNDYRVFRDRIIAAVLRVDDRRFRMQPPARGDRCKDGAVIVHVEVGDA